MNTPIYDAVAADLPEIDLEAIRTRPAWDTKRELRESGRTVAARRAAENAKQHPMSVKVVKA